MGRKIDPRSLSDRPEYLAALYLKNLGKRRHAQFFEGVVAESVDATHLKVRTAVFGTARILPVTYSDCDAEAFEVGDFVLCFAPNCALEKARVIGFTRQTRPCLIVEATVVGLVGVPAVSGPARTSAQLYMATFGGAGAWQPIGMSIGAGATAIRYFEEQGAYQMLVGYGTPVTFGQRITTRYEAEWGAPSRIAVDPANLSVDHGNHYHDYFPVFPAASSAAFAGDLGASLDDMFVSLCSTLPGWVAQTGMAWTGAHYVEQLDLLVVEGRDVGVGNTGVLVLSPTTGSKTQIWTPSSETTSVTTHEFYHPSWCRYAVEPKIFSYDQRDTDGVQGARGARTTAFYGLQYGGYPNPSRENSGAFGLVPGWQGGDVTRDWSTAEESFVPFRRRVHVTDLREEHLDGPPSPIIMVADGESYVLIPVVYREFARIVVVSPPAFTPGVSTEDDLNALPTMFTSFYGETLRRQRLYRVRRETGIATLLQDDDVSATKFNTVTRLNAAVGLKTINAVESRSLWRRRLYKPKPFPAHPDPLHVWWNPFDRWGNYATLTGAAGAPEPFTSIPMISPGGDILQELYDVPSTVAGNWQPLEDTQVGRVACWTFSWRADDADPENGSSPYDRGASNSALDLEGVSVDYVYDPVKTPKAHGESFKIYNVTTWTVVDTLIEGALTNPGSYLCHPCCTPNGKICVVAAHGYFRVPPLDWMFFAGLYRIDKTVPTAPTITLLSPCELIVPSGRPLQPGSDSVSGPLATGNERVLSVAEGTLIANPDILESRIAYWIGRRRKGFLDRNGYYVLGESGAALYVRPGRTVRLVDTFLRTVVSPNGNTPMNQEYEMGFRATWPQLYGNV